MNMSARKLAVLVCVGLTMAINSQSRADEAVAEIREDEFKALLETDKIISVQKSRDTIEGLYLTSQGNTNRFRVEYFYGPSIFVTDAISQKGIDVDFKPIDRDYSYGWPYYIDPTMLFVFGSFITIITLQILIFINIRKLRH